MPPVKFTKATASEMGNRGAAVRNDPANIAARSLAKAMLVGLPHAPYERLIAYQARRDREVMRRRMLKSTTGAEAGKYAHAVAELTEIERQATGRPMPGTLKPVAPKDRGPKFGGPE